jgi:hypothetical protein
VLLPSTASQWSQGQLAAVLTHEREHARRHDPLVQWLALLNRAVFWFHPLAWWLERRLSVLAEESCDAAVLERGHHPDEYVAWLMEIARAVSRAGGAVNINGAAMVRGSLARRLRIILEGKPAPRLSPSRMVGTILTCAVMSSVFAAVVVERAVALPPPLPVQVASAVAQSGLERIETPNAPGAAVAADDFPLAEPIESPGMQGRLVQSDEIYVIFSAAMQDRVNAVQADRAISEIPCESLALRVVPPGPGVDLPMLVVPPPHTGDEKVAVLPCRSDEPVAPQQSSAVRRFSYGGTFILNPSVTRPLLLPSARPADPCRSSEPALRPLSCSYKREE